MMKNYRETDPEFAERLEHFAFDEVVNEPGQQLDEVTRHMAILATLLGCQGMEVFRRELPQALDAGVTPVMAKEVVYQACAYLGLGRVRPFLSATNQVLRDRGVGLPLPAQGSPRACTPKAGMVAYYAPWGNLCFFYRDFRHSPGLVPLGRVDVAALQLSGRTGFFTMTLAPIPAAAAERTERAAAQ